MGLTGPRSGEHLLTWGVLLGGGGIVSAKIGAMAACSGQRSKQHQSKIPPPTTEPFAFHQCSTETDNNCGNLSHTLPLGFVCGPDAPLAQGLWFFESCACVLQDRVEGGVPEGGGVGGVVVAVKRTTPTHRDLSPSPPPTPFPRGAPAFPSPPPPAPTPRPHMGHDSIVPVIKDSGATEFQGSLPRVVSLNTTPGPVDGTASASADRGAAAPTRGPARGRGRPAPARVTVKGAVDASHLLYTIVKGKPQGHLLRASVAGLQVLSLHCCGGSVSEAALFPLLQEVAEELVSRVLKLHADVRSCSGTRGVANLPTTHVFLDGCSSRPGVASRGEARHQEYQRALEALSSGREKDGKAV